MMRRIARRLRVAAGALGAERPHEPIFGTIPTREGSFPDDLEQSTELAARNGVFVNAAVATHRLVPLAVEEIGCKIEAELVEYHFTIADPTPGNIEDFEDIVFELSATVPGPVDVQFVVHSNGERIDWSGQDILTIYAPKRPGIDDITE